MNYILTKFIYPLEESISISAKLNFNLDNPRTENEIDFISSLLIKSYESENNGLRLPIESDESIITLSGIVEKFNDVFSTKDKYVSEFIKTYNKVEIFRYISKMFIIARFEDEGEYERIKGEISKIREDGILAFSMLEDDHPLVKNSQNLRDYCSLISLLVNTEGKEYFGKEFLLTDTVENIQNNGSCRILNHNLMMWGFSIYRAEQHFELNESIENWDYGDWTFFPSIKDKIISVSSKLDEVISIGQESKFLYISSILSLTSKITDEKIKLLNLVGLIELLITHNPDFNRYNIEESINKQFILKTCILIHLIYPKEDLELLRKRLKIIYSQRSNIAHGNFKELEKYINKLSKIEGKEEYFSDLITDTYWYLRGIIEYYLKDHIFVDFIKEN